MRLLAAIFALSAVAGSPAIAAQFDDLATIICAPIEMKACNEGESCEAIRAEDIDAPRFLTISLKNKTIAGTRPSGEAIDAKIENVRVSASTIYVQGAQEEFGWSIAISQAGGDMTLVVSDSQTGVVMFGACTQR